MKKLMIAGMICLSLGSIAFAGGSGKGGGGAYSTSGSIAAKR